MKLHEDKFAFLNIINLIHEASSIRADILEKDYYVTLLLRELAGKQVMPDGRSYAMIVWCYTMTSLILLVGEKQACRSIIHSS